MLLTTLPAVFLEVPTLYLLILGDVMISHILKVLVDTQLTREDTGKVIQH